jgi:hypothetical protein
VEGDVRLQGKLILLHSHSGLHYCTGDSWYTATVCLPHLVTLYRGSRQIAKMEPF